MKTLPTHRFPRSRFLGYLALLGLAACDGGAAPLPLDPASGLRSHVAAHPPLPLQGRLAGTSTLSPGEGCEGLIATLTLSGTLSHLGSVTWTSTDCTSLAAFPPEISFTDGIGIITAANGDQLHFTYVGSALATPEGVALFTGEATITGGTGRFSGATGDFDFSGTVRLSDAAVELQVDGHTSYDASDRSGG